MACSYGRVQSEEQKKGFEAATFAENEVWGIDILVASGEDGKVRCLVYLPLNDVILKGLGLGSSRGVKNHYLPKRLDHHISAEDEDLACRLL